MSAEKNKLNELIEENRLLYIQNDLLTNELDKYYERLNINNDNYAGLLERYNRKVNNIDNISNVIKRNETSLNNIISNNLKQSPTFTIKKGFFNTILLLFKGGYSNVPTAALGGQEYSKVIEKYKKEGMEGVINLLNREPVTHVVWGNAFTAIAKAYRKINIKRSIELGWAAYQIDSKYYRLKWLAFLYYDAGNIEESMILIKYLPKDYQYSDKEKDKLKKISDKYLKSKSDKEKIISNFNEEIIEIYKKIKQEIENNRKIAENIKIVEKDKDKELKILEKKLIHEIEQNKIIANKIKEMDKIKMKYELIADLIKKINDL